MLVIPFSSTNLASAPGCWLNCKKQIGARAFATSMLACLSAMVVAVELVTQPPQVKPKIARATAPPATPQRAGLTFAEIFMIFPFKEREGNSVSQILSKQCTGPQSLLLYKTAHLPSFFAAAMAVRQA